MTQSTTQDQWARWLLYRRHGGDEERLRRMLEYLGPVRDKVLENAALAGDETLLDVGCGDGLIAFGALEKLDAGRVIFSDISQDLLDHCRELVAQMNVLDRCDFVLADAVNLAPIPAASVDVVTLRSVLIYVKAKAAALRAFHRVLKPGGTLSLFEPINRFGHPEPEHVLWGCDATPIIPLANRVKAVFNAIQPDDDPMLDFDERDLIALAEAAGFREVHLELQAQIISAREHERGQAIDWEQFLDTAPNPRIPTLREAIEQALTPAEMEAFTAHMRPLVEAGERTGRSAIAYLWAVKG
jgi:arsenite methyltransferase